MAEQSLSILRRKAVELRCGLSRSSIYDAVRDGRFPAPVRIGRRAVGWVASEVDAWLAAQVAARSKIA